MQKISAVEQDSIQFSCPVRMKRSEFITQKEFIHQMNKTHKEPFNYPAHTEKYNYTS